jgi:hypothetical protein
MRRTPPTRPRRRAPGPPPTPPAAAPSGLTKLLANARAVLFGLWTFTLAIPLFIMMLAMSPIVLLTDKFRWGGMGRK